jgi:hypothetical protein
MTIKWKDSVHKTSYIYQYDTQVLVGSLDGWWSLGIRGFCALRDNIYDCVFL